MALSIYKSLLQLLVEILSAPTSLDRATIRWSPEDKIMGLLHGLDETLRCAVSGLRNLQLETLRMGQRFL
jgi:hypothetical protein